MGHGRPEVRCLAARPITATGHYSLPALITLYQADYMRTLGFHIIGPDPADMAALAAWERAQEPAGSEQAE